MDRENNSGYLFRKIDSLEEQVAIMKRKHTEYDISEKNKRAAEDKDFRTVKEWFLAKERREDKFRASLDNLKKKLEADEVEKKKHRDLLDELYDEIHNIHDILHKRANKTMESELMEKLLELTERVDALQESSRILIDRSEHESLFEREMKLVTDRIVQDGHKEDGTNDERNEDTRKEIEGIKSEMENQNKEIKSQKIDQDLFIKATNLGMQSIRTELGGFNEFKKTTIHQVSFLRENIDEIDYYAKEMYAKQIEQNMRINTLFMENKSLREEYSNFREKTFTEIRNLQEIIEEMKVKGSNQSETFDSIRSAQEDSSASVNSSSKVKQFISIQEAIVGEWKLIACQNMEKLCKEHKGLILPVRKKDHIRIAISRKKITTYYNDNGVFKTAEKFKGGNVSNNSNCWYIDNQKVKSVNCLDSTKELVEFCTRYIDSQGRLVIVNELNGCSATRVYEKIC